LQLTGSESETAVENFARLPKTIFKFKSQPES